MKINETIKTEYEQLSIITPRTDEIINFWFKKYSHILMLHTYSMYNSMYWVNLLNAEGWLIGQAHAADVATR